MDNCLENNAKALTPSASQRIGFKSVFYEVVHILHQWNSVYKIDRIRTGGSCGKDTGTCHKMDLDMTFFINKTEPPFEDCLSELRSWIAEVFCISFSAIKQTDCSLQFRMYSHDIGKEVKVDLLPAPNFVSQTHYGVDICKQQQERTLDAIQNSQLTRRVFRSSFTEAAVSFVRNQSEYVRNLVRLTKFWKDSIYFEGGVTG